MERKDIKNWTVQGYYPNVPMFGFTEDNGIGQSAATDEYEFFVGESIYEVLLKNNLIEDPMVDANSWKCEWVANRWWVYRTNINVPVGSPRLVITGIDGEFSVFFKNKRLADFYNSFVELTIDLTEFCGESGELMIMVKNPTENLNQSGYTSKITTQRQRYDFKWDFCPRLVSLGIVAPVYVENGAKIIDTQIVTKNDGELKVVYDTVDFEEGMSVLFEIDNQKIVSNAPSGEIHLKIKNPKLWNCNGNGEANLYVGSLSILKDEKVEDERFFNVGFRSIEFVKNENSEEDSLPYTAVVNGEKTYIKGVCLVPIEMSRAEARFEKYEKIINLAKNMNVNMIRIWGGGIIETEDFYNLCDKNGIMVWQDFIQSSSGIDNEATVIEEGLERLASSVESAVKRIRNHPSLAVYCGGNELMDGNYKPDGFDHKNIALIKSLVDKYDGTRMMFPATASGKNPNGVLSDIGKGKHHDIHGPWTFDGNEEHYYFYNNIDSLLHSEFGVNGFCDRQTFDKIFSEKQREFSYIANNCIWRHKAEWWDSMPLLESIFGKLESVDETLLLGRFIQAEGVRYAAEANRRRAFNNSGCLVWQFNEPYPNLCCTSVVDYFCKPKPVYQALKNAYSAINPNMKYDKLFYAPNEIFNGEVFLTSEKTGEFDMEVQVTTDAWTKTFTEKTEISQKGKTNKVLNIEFIVPNNGGLRFTLKAKDKAGNEYVRDILLLIGSGGECSKNEVFRYLKDKFFEETVS